MQGGFGGGFGGDANNSNNGYPANNGYPNNNAMNSNNGYPNNQNNFNNNGVGANNMNTSYNSLNSSNLSNGNGGGVNSNNNNSNGGMGMGGGAAFGNAFGGHAQNMLMDIGKQNLEQYMKVGEQSFLTNYIPFVRDLRQYFRVDHQYVGRKTALLFAPFLQKKIARGSALGDASFVGGNKMGGSLNSTIGGGGGPSVIRSASATFGGVNAQYNFGDDGGFNNTVNNNNGGSPPPPTVATGGLTSPTTNGNSANGGAFKMPSPLEDVLAPDLYIPSMAVLTYVALCGFIRGLTDNTLAPEFLAAMLWSLILWEAFEVIVVMIASYALMTPMATLDALALAGYKHVGVCLLLLIRELLGLQDSWYIYIVPVMYVAGCAVLFAYNTINMFIARRGDGTVHVRSFPLLYGWAGVQALFVFWFAMKPF